MSEPSVWVFTGPNANFPAGVFSTREAAESEIRNHKLSGTVTRYVVDTLGYTAAVREGRFVPRKPEHKTPLFISRFANGAVHFHYEDGLLVS